MFYDQCFNFLFSRAQQKILQIFRERLAVYNITPIQYGVLSFLYQEKYCSAANLSEHFALEPSTITGILDRMEKKELILKSIDPGDRRAYKIEATEKGLALKADLMAATLQANREVEDIIGAENISFSKETLRRIIWPNENAT